MPTAKTSKFINRHEKLLSKKNKAMSYNIIRKNISEMTTLPVMGEKLYEQACSHAAGDSELKKHASVT